MNLCYIIVRMMDLWGGCSLLSCHTKTSLKALVIVIPNDGWMHNLQWTIHDIFILLFDELSLNQFTEKEIFLKLMCIVTPYRAGF